MEILDFRPKTLKMASLPWEPITIMPLGDIQAGIEACNLELLARKIDKGLKEHALFIGMGDYLDVASPTNRVKLKSAGFYDSVKDTLDEAMHRKEDMLMELLEPTKGRWLGMLEGHHTYEFQDGTTTDMNLCRMLGAPFLGTCAMIRLKFIDGAKHSVTCTIWAHHGVGSGVGVASPVTKLERVLEWAEADLYLMGHQHKRAAGATPRFYVVGDKTPVMIARERLLVGTGSYLRGYLQGSKSDGRPGGTYVEKAMMRPVSLGSPLIHVEPVRTLVEGKQIPMLEFEAVT